MLALTLRTDAPDSPETGRDRLVFFPPDLPAVVLRPVKPVGSVETDCTSVSRPRLAS